MTERIVWSATLVVAAFIMLGFALLGEWFPFVLVLGLTVVAAVMTAWMKWTRT